MQQYLLTRGIRLFNVIILMLSTIMVRAQDKIEIDKGEIGSWFERNWMWVVGGVVVLLLIALLGRDNGGKRKTTTVIKDADGKTKSITTVEERK